MTSTAESSSHTAIAAPPDALARHLKTFRRGPEGNANFWRCFDGMPDLAGKLVVEAMSHDR